jgi:predicted O-methyltransferase YrrM
MNQYADPNELRKLPRLLRAFAWRLPLEYGELMGKLTYKPFEHFLDRKDLTEYLPARGDLLDETAVTTGQRDILFKALAHTESMKEGVAEIGAWRGITTVALAERTQRQVFAVDPHRENEFPGINEAFQAFCQRTSQISNVVHVRQSSGDAARQLDRTPLSLVFVDAVHDYLNTWYDFVAWGNLLVRGGIIVLHDVDDHPGTHMAARRILKERSFRPWGYCPNIVAFEKIK